MFNCSVLEEDLPRYMPGLSLEITSSPREEVISSLVYNGSSYKLTNRTSQRPRFHDTAVNAMCDLISDLALNVSELRSDDLCFHAAAVALGSGLALFPATQRAGKSILSLALASIGGQVFSDDYLPVSLSEGIAVGTATGISPRIRLPLPETLSASLRETIEKQAGPTNRQYKYLPLGSDKLASANEKKGISAVVLLDRQDRALPVLKPAGRSTVLRALLKQNFATTRHGALVLEDLAALAISVPGFELVYSDPEEAAQLVLSELGSLKPARLESSDRPVVRPVEPEQTSALVLDAKQKFQRNQNCHAFVLDDCLFYARPDGSQIGHMDGSSVVLWHLFETPISLELAIEVLREAFPQVPAQQIVGDTRRVLRGFLEQGLIKAV